MTTVDAECTHDSESASALTGIWVVDEVRSAVERGYRVLEIHKFYEYQVTRYDPETCEGGHFTGYLDTFLKLKAEASGYPTWVRGAQDEEKYVRNFRDSEGIALDRVSISKDAAKRGLAKLCLNSFWGMLTEYNNRPKSKTITDPQELYRFVTTPGVEVTNLLFASDDVVWVTWKFADYE